MVKMRFKKLIDELGNYALEAKNPFLLCNSRGVSKNLLLSNESSVRLMTYVSVDEFVGERYVFKDSEPDNFHSLRKEYDVVWVEGRPAVKTKVRNFSMETDESRYFHKILKEGGKSGEAFFRTGTGIYPFLCFKPEKCEYDKLKNALKDIFQESN